MTTTSAPGAGVAPPAAIPTTLESQVSRLEGQLEGERWHLATKADLAQMEARLYRSFWIMTGTMAGTIIVVNATVTGVLIKLLG